MFRVSIGVLWWSYSSLKVLWFFCVSEMISFMFLVVMVIC